MRTIDGSRGEGGGQVARLALSLAAAAGEPIRVTNIRTLRPQPGLKAGHLAAVRALAQLCDGTVEGAELGSTDVTLRPGVIAGGDYDFAIETAGPVTLLLQTLMPPMVASRQRFSLRLHGGTNVSWAPQWDDLVMVHAPLLRLLGAEVTPQLVRRGYFPQGGGEVTVEVETPALRQLALDEPGPLRRLRAVISSHGLPRHVMERALISVQEGLHDLRSVDVEQDFHRGPGTGFAVALAAECASTVLGADSVGKKGTRVEDVVVEAVASLRAELKSGAALDIHQADQLAVFMALARGGSFTCRQLTPHARTVLEMLPELLPVRVDVRSLGSRTRVTLT